MAFNRNLRAKPCLTDATSTALVWCASGSNRKHIRSKYVSMSVKRFQCFFDPHIGLKFFDRASVSCCAFTIFYLHSCTQFDYDSSYVNTMNQSWPLQLDVNTTQIRDSGVVERESSSRWCLVAMD